MKYILSMHTLRVANQSWITGEAFVFLGCLVAVSMAITSQDERIVNCSPTITCGVLMFIIIELRLDRGSSSGESACQTERGPRSDHIAHWHRHRIETPIWSWDIIDERLHNTGRSLDSLHNLFLTHSFDISITLVVLSRNSLTSTVWRKFSNSLCKTDTDWVMEVISPFPLSVVRLMLSLLDFSQSTFSECLTKRVQFHCRKRSSPCCYASKQFEFLYFSTFCILLFFIQRRSLRGSLRRAALLHSRIGLVIANSFETYAYYLATEWNQRIFTVVAVFQSGLRFLEYDVHFVFSDSDLKLFSFASPLPGTKCSSPLAFCARRSRVFSCRSIRSSPA